MKFFSVRSFVRSRYPFAIGAGLVLAASFPKIGIAGFAWIAPALMLAAALGKRGGETFRLGYVAGLAHYLASLYWLLLIPVTGFPILGWVALGAYLALYPALWVWLALKMANGKWQMADSSPAQSNWLAAIREIAAWSWGRRMGWAFSCAALWVTQEMILTRLFTGFPWNLLGVSQHGLLPLIQIASVAGVPGLSFLIAWMSVSLLCAAAVIITRPKLRSVWLGEIILPLAALMAVFAFGLHRLRQAPATARELKITMIQPSIPQTLIWNSENDLRRFQELIALSEQALTNETDVLIWPEAAIPKLIRYDEEIFQTVTNLAGKHRVWLIVGSDDAEQSRHSSNPDDADYFNASFLISPEGRFAGRYCKRSLVIFGEYIPLVRWLPFIKWFTPIQGGFTPGERAVPFEMPDLDVRTSVLICFEDSFPYLAREGADLDADFLVNLTNNGWFGEGAAQWQHLATALFRAVENGRPLIRCTNTGLTCWVDATGRVRDLFADRTGSVYGAGFQTMKLPLPAAGQRPPPTFYQQHGDWFGWSCVGLAAMTLVLKRRKTSV